MQTAIQIVLIVSVASLTIIFVTVGVWVILILREVRRVLTKLDKVSADVEETSAIVKEKVKQSLSAVTILTALGTLWTKRDNIGDIIEEIKGKGDSAEPDLSTEQIAGREEENKNRKRRFFKRK